MSRTALVVRSEDSGRAPASEWAAHPRSFRAVAGALGGLVLRAWLGTLRVEVDVAPELDPAEAIPWVLALFHGEQMPLLAWPRRRRTYVLVSRSRDGELQGGALGALGFGIERGSSSRGGAAGLRALVRRLGEGHDAAFAVDGPRGPLQVAKPGAIAAARRARARLVPMGAAVDRSYVLDQTWDQYRIVRPFARVVVSLGPGLDAERTTCHDLAAAIHAAHARAQQVLFSTGLLTRVNSHALPGHPRRT